MKLSKRERVLLIIMAVTLLFAGVWFFAVSPALDAIETKKQELGELEFRRIEIETALGTAEAAGDRLGEETSRAEENYDNFYSTLNSYTIDDILSELMLENSLEVESLAISKYEKISESELFGAEPEIEAEPESGEEKPPEPEYLMMSTVQIQAGGSYEDIMAFIDSMNGKSYCLRVSAIQISFASDRNEFPYEARMICEVDIYGIEQPDGLIMA